MTPIPDDIEGSSSIGIMQSDYADGPRIPAVLSIAAEAPIAIETNGIAYAVMMATPLQIEDFVTGFLLSEGLAEAHEIADIVVCESDHHEWGAGYVARVNLPVERLGPIVERARRRVGDSSCGICGIEGIDAALRPLPRLPTRTAISPVAVKKGLDAMRQAQVLGRRTRATHAAAFCDTQGEMRFVREDVGRHNALDKLIGAMARGGVDSGSGFIAMTSRCSYELVEKTVRAGCSMLITISAPTDLAVRRARAAGLTLGVIARDDCMSMIDPDGPLVEE